MKSLIVYDSQYGNTKKIAEAITSSLKSAGRALAIHASDVQAGDISGTNLLVVGSPTQRLTATPAVLGWIQTLPKGSLEGVRAAAFDTRFTQEHISSIKVLPFFVRIFGYAAKPIAGRLEKKGAEIIAPAEGFYVLDTEGPLLDQELERAAKWAESLISF